MMRSSGLMEDTERPVIAAKNAHAISQKSGADCDLSIRARLLACAQSASSTRISGS